jgi:hypothetical protein
VAVIVRGTGRTGVSRADRTAGASDAGQSPELESVEVGFDTESVELLSLVLPPESVELLSLEPSRESLVVFEDV